LWCSHGFGYGIRMNIKDRDDLNFQNEIHFRPVGCAPKKIIFNPTDCPGRFCERRGEIRKTNWKPEIRNTVEKIPCLHSKAFHKRVGHRAGDFFQHIGKKLLHSIAINYTFRSRLFQNRCIDHEPGMLFDLSD